MQQHLITCPQQYDYLIVLDFEANCENGKVLRPQEIIEFPCVVYNVKKNVIDRRLDFSYFCKIDTPLTAFCTELTSITQAQSDAGVPLHALLNLHKQWLDQAGGTTLFVTCGDWDLKTALPNHCKYLKIPVPHYFKRWANVKVLYEETYGRKSYGMKGMLQKLNLSLDGTHHRGLDDCANIAKVVQRLVLDGCKFKVTSSTG